MATSSTSVSSSILEQARILIGKTYKEMDCSHFVHAAFKAAGLDYPYRDTKTFSTLASGDNAKFELVPTRDQQEGDVILMDGHMGIFDPKGCATLPENPECSRLENNAPFLSSRSSKKDNPGGPEFGRTAWWSKSYKVYRWKQPNNQPTQFTIKKMQPLF